MEVQEYRERKRLLRKCKAELVDIIIDKSNNLDLYYESYSNLRVILNDIHNAGFLKRLKFLITKRI